MNKERLLNVSRALRESKNPELFTMARYGHGCGTPGCALGHYAARRDMQSDFILTNRGDLEASVEGLNEYQTVTAALRHFDIDREQEEKLFGSNGCGNAKTPNEAAGFIEQFVESN